MSLGLRTREVRAVLLDIEGTTTPIAFVHDVLFPFARANLNGFLSESRNAALAADVTALLKREHEEERVRGGSPPPWMNWSPGEDKRSAERYLHFLMDRDRKSPALKLLQGHIWERGYRDGELKGSVFADVVPAIRRWRDAGCDVAIYSSGSVLAQRLLFASTPEGDLTPLFRAFFDTGAGAKTSPASYANIVTALESPAADVLFISDVTTELSAARTAGLQVALSLRPGNPAQPDAAAFESIRSFDEVEVRTPDVKR